MQIKAGITEKTAGIVIFILYIVGAAGYLLPFTRDLFLLLTPANLVLTGLVILYFHYVNQAGPWWPLAAVFSLGFLSEVLGVATGVPFGNYRYGETLGVKLWEVPLTIGINWLVLGYAFSAVSRFFIRKKMLAVTTAALAMVALDLVIEPVAVRYDYWQWEKGIIPVSNFIGWFVVAISVQTILIKCQTGRNEKIGTIVIIAQLIFFVTLYLFR